MSRFGVDDRYGPLAKDSLVFGTQSKKLIGRQEFNSGLVSGGTGHQIEWDRGAVTLPQSNNPLDQDLEKRSAGNGANRQHAFGVFKSQPASHPTSDDHHGDSAGR